MKLKVWNWRLEDRAANQAIFTYVEFGNSNKWIKLLNKDNFRPSNRKSPLNKLFEQFVKQRRHFLPGQCQKNQWDCTFLTSTAIWKIAIQVEAYFCKRRVRKILNAVRELNSRMVNQEELKLEPSPNQESERHIQLFWERLSEKMSTRQSHVKRIELKLRSDCPKDFFRWL